MSPAGRQDLLRRMRGLELGRRVVIDHAGVSLTCMLVVPARGNDVAPERVQNATPYLGNSVSVRLRICSEVAGYRAEKGVKRERSRRVRPRMFVLLGPSPVDRSNRPPLTPPSTPVFGVISVEPRWLPRPFTAALPLLPLP